MATLSVGNLLLSIGTALDGQAVPGTYDAGPSEPANGDGIGLGWPRTPADAHGGGLGWPAPPASGDGHGVGWP